MRSSRRPASGRRLVAVSARRAWLRSRASTSRVLSSSVGHIREPGAPATYLTFGVASSSASSTSPCPSISTRSLRSSVWSTCSSTAVDFRTITRSRTTSRLVTTSSSSKIGMDTSRPGEPPPRRSRRPWPSRARPRLPPPPGAVSPARPRAPRRPCAVVARPPPWLRSERAVPLRAGGPRPRRQISVRLEFPVLMSQAAAHSASASASSATPSACSGLLLRPKPGSSGSQTS
jgi:hypothetical protein